MFNTQHVAQCLCDLVHSDLPVLQVIEDGDYELDGVAFPSAKISLEFIAPADAAGALFPTGRPQDRLTVPGIGEIPCTLISGSSITFSDLSCMLFFSIF